MTDRGWIIFTVLPIFIQMSEENKKKKKEKVDQVRNKRGKKEVI